MARVKRGTTSKARHKRVLVRAKGFFGSRKNTIRIAKQAVERAEQYRYRDRRRRKRDFRRLWIQRLNAAVRQSGMRYAQFICAMSLLKIRLNRKVLSELAVSDPKRFEELVAKAQNAWKTQKPESPVAPPPSAPPPAKSSASISPSVSPSESSGSS